MKKAFIVFFSLLLLLCALSGCTNCTDKDPESAKEKSDKLSIVTTIFPQYDFVRQIAGDKVELKMLLSPGMEAHSFDPSPSDIISVESCDLFICVGGESEYWATDMFSSLETKNVEVISLMDTVELYTEEAVNDSSEHEHESEEAEYDEHVWTSPKNAIAICEAITEKLCALDKANASLYTENSKNYIAELNKLDKDFREMSKNASDKPLIVGDRFPFRYLTEEYSLDYLAAFPGCSSETEPSAATISQLVDSVKKNDISVVFYIEFSSGKVASAIADETGAKTLLLHSCHNLTQDEFDGGETYLSLMRNNLENITEALS